MKKISISHLILMSIFLLAPQSIFSQGTYLWDSARLREIKSNPTKYQNLYSQSRRASERYLSEPLILITDKPATFVSDTHNYVSMSPYYWPDPTDPRRKYILKDGQMNPEYNKYDGMKLQDLELKMRMLSIAYYLSNDEKYRSAYMAQLTAFFIDSRTYMYPNFEHAQFAPGHNNNAGRAAGIIEAYNFCSIIESIRLVNYVKSIDSQVMEGLRDWFSQFSHWLETSENGIQEYNTNTNHGIAYDVLLINIELFCHDSLNEDSYKTFRSRRLKTQFAKNGSQPEELKRTRSFHYSTYNLIHVIDLCKILNSAGVDYYSKNKDIIDPAFNFLLQYIGHKDRYPYKEISKSWDLLETNLLREYNRLPGMNKNKSKYPFDFYSSIKLIHL